jgi:hypothetical protein
MALFFKHGAMLLGLMKAGTFLVKWDYKVIK